MDIFTFAISINWDFQYVLIVGQPDKAGAFPIWRSFMGNQKVVWADEPFEPLFHESSPKMYPVE